MLDEDLQADAHQDAAAEDLGKAAQKAAELFPQPGTGQTAEKGDDADGQSGHHNIHLHNGKTDTHGQSIDAGGHCLHHHGASVQGAVHLALILFPHLPNGLDDHFAPDEPQQDQSDPVIQGGDEIAEAAPGHKADHRHARLEQAEQPGIGGSRLSFGIFVADAVGDRHGCGVHGQPQGQQDEGKYSHVFPLFLWRGSKKDPRPAKPPKKGAPGMSLVL